jgi:cephalosporin hydroxylase
MTEIGGAHHLVDDCYRFDDDWFSTNIPVLAEHFGKLAGQENLKMIEVGSWEGRSAVWFLETILTDPSGELHCIDPWAAPTCGVERAEANFDRNMMLARRHGGARVIKHKRASAEVLPTFARSSANIVYVDGCHLAKDVLTDIVLAWPILAAGGILVCDDYELEQGMEFHDGFDSYPIDPPPKGPKVAVDAFLSCFEHKYRILFKGWQVLIEKTSE